MSKMISVASGFQYSVNIGYDLNNDDKIKNFIPTQSSLKLLEEILLSTVPSSNERSRILIGAYGKGKSHIVLMILSMLLKKDLILFEKVLPKIKENTRLYQLVQNYYDTPGKILPIVISGSNTSLTQAFLLSLQRTLSDNNLLDIMPETNYKAAITVIKRWETEFPETYKKFEKAIGKPVKVFIDELSDYNISSYEEFDRLYPKLTAGSKFNPFLGFDVVELFENVAYELNSKGYRGIYVIYDEFSKYLEANITGASVSDTKMLQDFAEKCSRSGKTQMHIMLISHKEIANYIDKLPKQKVDGWRGVSERFKHIHLNNNFSQTYEIIASVIQKSKEQWESFVKEHQCDFLNIEQLYKGHLMFEKNTDELNTAIYGCYPLHPVATFILPRLSERVAQNERTLFTFLSADGELTLKNFLKNYNDAEIKFVTPDIIYDYFEPLFRKELYDGELHETFILASSILSRLEQDSLEAKIVKTIALIYILAQFERLKPTKAEIIGIFSASYSPNEINNAIERLIEEKLVVYLKRSNNFMKLKKTSGIDVRKKIHDMCELLSTRVAVKNILNKANYNNYLYPSRYNDEYEMTRFFVFQFIDASEVKESTNWQMKSEGILADAVIYAVIPKDEESIQELKQHLLDYSAGFERHIFIVPKSFEDIYKTIYEYAATATLREEVEEDPVLFDEYDVIYEDLSEVIAQYISTYTCPELYKAIYIYNGKEQDVHRRAALSELMSSICSHIYSDTPLVNNEAVNKNDLTRVAINSRNKVITALLRNQLEPNLGLTGSGQEVSIMRSTLLRTGIVQFEGNTVSINLHPADVRMANMLNVIEKFVLRAHQTGGTDFNALYDQLTSPAFHIGLRKGLIPIYLAVVLHEYRKQVIIHDKYNQVPIDLDTILQINANPGLFTLSYLDWNSEKEDFVKCVADIFSEYIIPEEKNNSTYDYAVDAMKRWMMALPKYVKECKQMPDGVSISKQQYRVLSLLRQNVSNYEFLFIKLPKIFQYESVGPELAEKIQSVKSTYDNLLEKLKYMLIDTTKNIFILAKDKNIAQRMSLTSVMKEWEDTLEKTVFEQLFSDGTDKILSIIKSITYDEDTFIVKLAKALTGLRIEDWDDGTFSTFLTKLMECKNTAEKFHADLPKEGSNNTANYQLTFVDNEGTPVVKRFNRVEISKRGNLLYNQITQALDAMGQAVSTQEKRQILMSILKDMC